MHYFIYAQKDATIYSGSVQGSGKKLEEQNTGADSVLELQRLQPTLLDSTSTVSRILLNFNLKSLKTDVDNGVIPSTAKYCLRLFNAQSTEIPFEDTIFAYPLSQSYEMGIGKFDDVPITKNGVTWSWPDVSGSVASQTWTTGGNFYTSSDGNNTMLESSQSFEAQSPDLNIDVTTIVTEMLQDDYFANGFVDEGYGDEGEPNHGFLLKRSDSDENGTTDLGNLQFFSADTNTIYVPRLEVKWDDVVYNTGTLTEIDPSGDVDVYMKGLRDTYLEKSEPRFRLVFRERYPSRTIYKTPQNVVTKVLPSGSAFYSIRDAHTEEVLFDFDEYTGISSDSNGNYFNLKMDGLQPERHYKIIYKVIASGSVNFYDNDFSFKVVR